jgi:myo-inositol-1(or 4)-monophosphatase
MNSRNCSQWSARAELLKELVLIGARAIKAAVPSTSGCEKAGRGNVVTPADEASERAILERLSEVSPGDAILSEESQSDWSCLTETSRLWVIDPIDGTNNHRYGRHYCAVSVGYVEEGELAAGAVYDPFRDELFFAEIGKGAFLNGSPIRVGGQQDLSSATVATDNCYSPQGTRENLELCLRLDPLPWILIRGSAVLSLCEVACGRTDLYFHTALKPWDSAAAFLIVREAGGRVARFDGTRADFRDSSAIAGNDTLVEQCMRRFRPE